MAVLALAVSCTSDQGAGVASTPEPAAPGNTAAASSPSPEQDSDPDSDPNADADADADAGSDSDPVKAPPELDDSETVVARRGETRGGGTFEFGEGEKGEALIIAVRCQGKGEIEVSVKPVNVGFPLECVDGRAGTATSTAYNQVDVAGVEKKGTVSVLAPSSVRWSMTIGRG
ncbi:hypothetical protein AB0H92_31760 [Streptomyces phaeochromogenes]|uniref:hypothetical protein n=1 Tax=Streptomyces phaeochromogenes TaxID=1923 RepID=UPI0033E8B817